MVVRCARGKYLKSIIMIIALIANPAKFNVKETIEHVGKWSANKAGTKIVISRELHSQLDEPKLKLELAKNDTEAVSMANAIVVIGGDGTMLYTAKICRGLHKPILGVNTGRLGFMASTQQEQIVEALNHLVEGKYTIDKRHLLQAKLADGSLVYALNEFLFIRKDSTAMISITAHYDGNLVNNYWADGLIVSSPTGSTAYNLSSGGPIILPGTEVMVITPINPHSLTTRPLVLGSNKKLKITVEEQPVEVLFSNDGEMHEIHQLPFSVEIDRSNFTMDLIQLPGQHYFETLRNKLMWGLDRRRR